VRDSLTGAPNPFYNNVLAQLGQLDLKHFPAARNADLSNPYTQFQVARQVTLWHYQWLLVNEHLPHVADQAVVTDVLDNGPQFYTPPAGDAFLPIEFGAAAYRLGHSQVRPSYRATSPAAPATYPAPPPTRSSPWSSTPPSQTSTVPSPRTAATCSAGSPPRAASLAKPRSRPDFGWASPRSHARWE
jgi:hypothetical protein